MPEGPEDRSGGGGSLPADSDVRVLINIGRLVTCAGPDGPASATGAGEAGGGGEPAGIEGGALAWSDGEIRWAGPESELPREYRGRPAWDAGGRLVIPGLVDCHTHLAFGGWRDDEFEARIRGKSYAEIAREGGGILSTVRATRAATEDALLRRSRGFLRGMARRGVTTVEAKSGYGLRLEDELKQLRVYRRLGREGPLRVIPTFLGAHTVPPEYRGDRSAYVDRVIGEMIPRVAEEGLARCCDVFVEEGAFTVDEGRRILEAGKARGLSPKVHADQLGPGGGAELAAAVGALSADHLEHVSGAGMDALGGAGVVAVGLPLASLYLDGPYLPARALLDRGATVAAATDFNPGTAPSYDLPLALLLACTRWRFTPGEALRGATVAAARACGAEGGVGTLTAGAPADFAVMDAVSLRHWLYHFRGDACLATVAGGRVVWRRPDAPEETALPDEDRRAWPPGPGPRADDR